MLDAPLGPEVAAKHLLGSRSAGRDLANKVREVLGRAGRLASATSAMAQLRELSGSTEPNFGPRPLTPLVARRLVIAEP
jgi:hypothetical protein